MKRKVASRKLKRTCLFCNKGFRKGQVYYVDRNVFSFGDTVKAYEDLFCAKCIYKTEDQKERFFRFQKTCKHPKEFVHTEYDYIPGEAVMEPSHTECYLCHQVVN